MHAVLIRNPISGNPHRQHALDQALAEFVRAGWRLDIRQTERKGHARQLAQEAAAQGHDRIIIAGGDGSIGQVADGIVRSGRTDVRMGVIPLGTGNVFARELGLPFPRSSRDDAAVRAVRIILAEDAKPLDVGVANDQAFLCWAGCGIDANVTEEVETNLAFDKRQSPLKTYIVALLKQLRGFESPRMSVTVDGQERLEGKFALVIASNIALYARYLRITPRAHLDDGYLDLLLIDADHLLPFAYTALKIVLFPAARGKRIIRRRFRQLQVESDRPASYHLDGDPLGTTPLTISVLPRRLPVYLDARTARKRLT
ncbi:MAG TPA: YegS/Rv2252/BmrU family lipid kinase [Caldilineae bacterium]|nr:YegS/Rv2252/BmrU family lipid kinase [Caldilineae bacterium]